tara:strand:+ start:634 stop:807 length:174 start_codon:yes stop_codon:yes gene_type:complete
MRWTDVALGVGFLRASNGAFAELMFLGALNNNGLQIKLAVIATATQLDLTGVFSGGR